MATALSDGAAFHPHGQHWRHGDAVDRFSDLCGTGAANPQRLCAVVEAQIVMNAPRWIGHPRMLAALTLAFALVPEVITFKAVRELDAKLFETAMEVLAKLPA